MQARQRKHCIGGSTSRERDWCRHVKINIASADRQVERERERENVCVLFEFRQFVFLLWNYVFQSFVSIFAKKKI